MMLSRAFILASMLSAGSTLRLVGATERKNELALLCRYTVIRYSLNAEQLLCGFFLFEDHVGSLHSKYCWRVKIRRSIADEIQYAGVVEADA